MEPLIPPDLQALIDKGDVLECPGCGALNAYAFQDATVDPNTGERLHSEEPDPHPDWPPVYIMGAASGLGEWACGKCRTPWVRIDSPLNAEVYTHHPPEAQAEG